MKKIRTIGAAALLLGVVATVGCGADGSDPLGEPVGTEAEELGLLNPIFNPSNCKGSASQCTTCIAGTNTCMTMHCCPQGQAMTGVHLGENTFQCRGVVGAAEASCRLVTTGLRTFPPNIQVRACPPGFYMKGLHAGNNALMCCEYPSFNSSTTSFLDGPNGATQVLAPRIKDPPWPWAGVCGDAYMHGCPGASAMEGFSIGNNWLVCGS